jgi:hypothetical protein
MAHMERRLNTYGVLAGKPEEERPLGSLRYTQEDNIKMNLKRNGIGRHGLDSSGL